MCKRIRSLSMNTSSHKVLQPEHITEVHTPEIYRRDFFGFASDMFQRTKRTVLSFQHRHELLAGKDRESDATMRLERRTTGSNFSAWKCSSKLKWAHG